MIALLVIPLRWADPESRKVLVHDESKPSERFAGEDGQGFYDARRALSIGLPYSSLCRSDLTPLVVPCGRLLYSVFSLDGYGYSAIYIEHFSAPTDADDHFVEAPLLALPDVPEDTLDTQSGPVAASNVGAAPVPHKVPGGDTAMPLSGEQPFPELFGGME